MKVTKKECVLMVASVVLVLICFIAFDYFYTVNFYNNKMLSPINGAMERLDNGFYALRKNVNGYTKWGNYEYKIITDSEGFRVGDSLEVPQRPADIVFLGDSFTFGVNGPWDETFVGMVEKETGRNVLNAGVGSYSPTTYLFQYQKIINNSLANSRHDLIIGIDISDVQDEARYWVDGPVHPVKSNYIDKGHLKEVNKAFDPVLPQDRFHLSISIYEFIKSLFTSTYSKKQCTIEGFHTEIPRSAFTWMDWRLLDVDQVEIEGLACDAYTKGGVEKGLANIEKKIVEIAKLAERNDARVYLLVYPWPAQLKHNALYDWPKFSEKLCQRISCSGIINLFPDFLDEPYEIAYKKYFVAGDVHYNKYGNELVARNIVQKLKKNTLGENK